MAIFGMLILVPFLPVLHVFALLLQDILSLDPILFIHNCLLLVVTI